MIAEKPSIALSLTNTFSKSFKTEKYLTPVHTFSHYFFGINSWKKESKLGYGTGVSSDEVERF